MATEVVKVIDPDMGSGYDYDSLFDWEAAQQGDLTGARNEIAVAKCRCTGGTADTTAVTIDGWTTSATQYIKIWTDTAESYRHNGTYQTGNKYRMEVSAGADIALCLELVENYVRVIGLAFKMTNNSYLYCAFSLAGTVDAAGFRLFESCVGKFIASGSVQTYGFGGRSGYLGDYAFVNNIIFDVNGASGFCLAGCNKTGSTNYYYNNTCVDSILGINAATGASYKAINNIFSGCTAACAGTFVAGSGYNVTNLASMGYTVTGGATDDRLSKSFTFADAGADDFHLVAADADSIGYGLNLYNDASYPFQTDIDGQDRGGAAAAWDIGADEYVSAASIELEGFRFRNDDGSESAATWKANQDTNITLPADTAARIRMLLNATGDPASIGAQLEYRYKPSGGAFGSWAKVN